MGWVVVAFILGLSTTGSCNPTTPTDETPSTLLGRISNLLDQLNALVRKFKSLFLQDESLTDQETAQIIDDVREKAKAEIGLGSVLDVKGSVDGERGLNKGKDANDERDKTITTLRAHAMLVFDDPEGSGDVTEVISLDKLGQSLSTGLDQRDKGFPDVKDKNIQKKETTGDLETMLQEEEMMEVTTRAQAPKAMPETTVPVTTTEEFLSKTEKTTLSYAEQDRVTAKQPTKSPILFSAIMKQKEELSMEKDAHEENAPTVDHMYTTIPFERAAEGDGRMIMSKSEQVKTEPTRTGYVEGKEFPSPTSGIEEEDLLQTPAQNDLSRPSELEQQFLTPEITENEVYPSSPSDTDMETDLSVQNSEFERKSADGNQEIPEGPPGGAESPEEEYFPSSEVHPGQEEFRNGPDGDYDINDVIQEDRVLPPTTHNWNPYAIGSDGPTYSPKAVSGERFWTPRCTRPGLYLPHPYNPCMFIRCDFYPHPHQEAAPPALMAQSYICGLGTGVPRWFFSGNITPCLVRDDKCL